MAIGLRRQVAGGCCSGRNRLPLELSRVESYTIMGRRNALGVLVRWLLHQAGAETSPPKRGVTPPVGGFGSGSLQKPSKHPKPYEFIGFGAIHGPKPYEFTGFGDMRCAAPPKVR